MNEYFSHDYRARYDNKLVSLTMKHGLAGIGAYWCIVEMCYESNGYVERSQYERIAFELRSDAKFIKSVVEDFKLFQFKGDRFFSQTALERLKKRNEKSEKARSSVAARWAKSLENKDVNASNTNVSRTKNESSTIKGKKRIGKNNKENNTSILFTSSKENTSVAIQDENNSKKPKEKSCAKKENRNSIPPTLEMVTAYCEERKNGVNPAKFIDHYTAKNWCIGKQKMCDWQAAIRTWENNTANPQPKEYGKD